MVNDIFPILVSFIYVIAVLLVAYLLESHGRLGRESARKLVHFLVSLWVFVMVYWMDSLWARILGPIAFIFINTFMTLKAREGRAVGMIFFPVALLAVSILYSFSLISAETAISSVLVMGAGDSAAALIGTRYGRHQLFSKSIEGFTAMFAVSFIVLLAFSSLPWEESFLIAFVAAAAEVLAPHGLDNLTVPFAVILMMEVL